MVNKHCFYKYGSVALSCLFFLMLTATMTLRESEQSKTKQPLKIFKKQNVSVKTEQNTTPVIFLPPPPLKHPKLRSQTSKVLQRPYDSNLTTTPNRQKLPNENNLKKYEKC